MITVIIAAYGDQRWHDIAWSRAYPSASVAFERAGIEPEIVVNYRADATLADVRNEGADQATRPWLCFLDADDELDPGYILGMAGAGLRHGGRGDTVLLTPAVQWIHGRKRYRPRFQPEVRYQDGNWLVIGTMIDARTFHAVGGFEEWPMYEDWALFARAQHQQGAVPVRVPSAVYIAHRTPGSRNHGTRAEKLAAHDMIRRAVFPELYEDVA